MQLSPPTVIHTLYGVWVVRNLPDQLQSTKKHFVPPSLYFSRFLGLSISDMEMRLGNFLISWSDKQLGSRCTQKENTNISWITLSFPKYRSSYTMSMSVKELTILVWESCRYMLVHCGLPILYMTWLCKCFSSVSKLFVRFLSRQWTSGRNGGFSSVTPWLPVNKDHQNAKWNVQDAAKNENSTLNLVKTMAELKNRWLNDQTPNWCPNCSTA